MKRIILIAVALLTLVIVAIVNLVPEQRQPFALVSVAPASGSTVSPDSTTLKFKFNRPLSLLQNYKGFSLEVSPDAEAVYGVVGDTLNVNLSNLSLVDATEYTITLNGVADRQDKTLSQVVSTIKVKFADNTASALTALPHRGDGFIVTKSSDYTIQVIVTKKPFGTYSALATSYLAGSGIDGTKFDIAIDSAYTRSGSIDEGSIQH